MKTHRVEISQNHWEYTGYALITCNTLKQVGEMTVDADGVTITFDEPIRVIHETD